MQRPVPAAILALLVVPLLLLGCTTTPETAEPPATEEPAAEEPADSSTGDEAGGTTDVAALIEERCVGCHELDRIKTADHDEAGWTSTVSRMRSAGAELTDEEARSVVEFLAGGGASDL